jgi:hypothetical protein
MPKTVSKTKKAKAQREHLNNLVLRVACHALYQLRDRGLDADRAGNCFNALLKLCGSVVMHEAATNATIDPETLEWTEDSLASIDAARYGRLIASEWISNALEGNE